MLPWGGYFEAVRSCSDLDTNIHWNEMKKIDPIFEILENIETAPDIDELFRVICTIKRKHKDKLNSPFLDSLTKNAFVFPQNTFNNGNIDVCKFILSKGYTDYNTAAKYILNSEYDMVEIIQLLFSKTKLKLTLDEICFRKHIKIIKFFISQSLTENKKLCYFFIVCCKYNIIEILKFLKDNTTINLLEKDKNLCRYVDLAFSKAAEMDNVESMKFINESCTPPSAIVFEEEITRAILNKNKNSLKFLLTYRDTFIPFDFENFYIAVKQCDEEILNILIDNIKDMDISEHFILQCLELSLSYSRANMVKILLERMIHITACLRYKFFLTQPVLENNRDLVKVLVENIDNYLKTIPKDHEHFIRFLRVKNDALLKAVETNNKELVIFLLEHGVSPYERNDFCNTAFTRVTNRELFEILNKFPKPENKMCTNIPCTCNEKRKKLDTRLKMLQ